MLPLSALAQTSLPSLSAEDARALQESGDLVLIDIRQPEEWRETGMAQGAVGVSMMHPEGGQGFLRDVLAAVDGDTDAAIALICRTGNRTSQVVPALMQWGFTRVYHIPEGMVGSRFGPGWIPGGLPMEGCTSC
ncbi:MAG: rhodanese-like domain-containing protein [Wenzhouxiangella sp.]